MKIPIPRSAKPVKRLEVRGLRGSSEKKCNEIRNRPNTIRAPPKYAKSKPPNMI